MEMKCAKSVVLEMNKLIITGHIHKLAKMAKPVLRLLTRRRRTNAVTPSSCNYECTQNDQNESTIFQVDFRFHEAEKEDNLKNEQTEMDENDLNEALERRLQEEAKTKASERLGVLAVCHGERVVVPVVTGTYFAVPACFVETVPGELTWVPLPTADSDVATHGDSTPHSQCQVPQQQVPCC